MKLLNICVLGSCFFLLTAAAANADIQDVSKRLKSCRNLTSMLTRVQCYDQVTDDFNLDTLNKHSVGDGPGKWKVTFEKSPLTDDQNVYLSLTSTDYITNRMGKPFRPSIVIRCMEGKLEAYADFNSELGKDTTSVNTRVGNGEVVAERWRLSGDMMGAFIPNPLVLTKKMINEDTFFLKISPPYSNPLEATFDIRGLFTAIQPLAKACNITDLPTAEAIRTPEPVKEPAKEQAKP